MSVSLERIRKEFNEKAYGKSVMVGKFFRHAIKNQTKSQKAGYPVYDDQLFITIKTQGRKDTTSRKATEQDTEIFQAAWEKFQREEQHGEPMPLKILPAHDVKAEAYLKDIGVLYVEQLAEYDGDLPTYELNVMRHAARAYLRFWMDYTPPRKEDVRIPENRTVHGPGNREDLRESHRVAAPSGAQKGNGIGVFLGENGEVVGFGGQAPEEEGGEEEAFQEVGQEIEGHGTGIHAEFVPPDDPLEGLVA